MKRPTDEETTAMGKIAVILTDPKGRGGHMGKDWGDQEAEGKGQTMGESPYCGLHLKVTLTAMARSLLSLGTG